MSNKPVLKEEGTTLAFTPDELTELAYHLAAGDVLLKKKTRLLYRVIEAMARLGAQTSN
ncbi:hypothetical protein [Streptomyces sp. NPDC059970]|uniref:hypothetical protein n=1 Tax=Streptomyces sp. NPDC059970 TaxID=3347019 RepID=UPI0036CEEA14